MIILERSFLSLFRTKLIYFAEEPFDVGNCNSVHFYNCSKKVDKSGFSRAEKTYAVVDLDRDLDTIFRGFNQNTRTPIRRAERLGTEVRINKDFKEFFSLYSSFIRKKGLYHRFGIPSVNLNLIEKYGTLFAGHLDGRMLAGNLYLEDESHSLLWLSASRRLDMSKEESSVIGAVNRLLHWEAMKYAKQKGIKNFNLEAIDTNEIASDTLKPSITRFKMSFGCSPKIEYSYSKSYSYAYKLAKNFVQRD